MWRHMDGWGPDWGWFAIGHVLWWVVLVVALIVLLRWAVPRGARRSAAGPDRALELLRERFARGEIDETEFEARKRALDGRAHGPGAKRAVSESGSDRET